jgi:tryptophan-rich hypothetical protein
MRPDATVVVPQPASDPNPPAAITGAGGGALVRTRPPGRFSPASRDLPPIREWPCDIAVTGGKHTDFHAMNALHPKKLLLSKWTAVAPVGRNKHFLVSKVIEPEPPEFAVRWVDIEAVHSKSVQRIEWRELKDATRWRQGWV